MLIRIRLIDNVLIKEDDALQAVDVNELFAESPENSFSNGNTQNIQTEQEYDEIDELFHDITSR
jgi:hypothetical protein